LKILIVKLSSLGDVVHAMPAVQDLRRALPHAQVDWVVEKGFAPLVRRCNGVQRVITCELRRWRKSPLAAATRAEWRQFRAELQQETYDAVVDLQGLAKSALVSRCARLAPVGRRVAMANRTEGSSYEAATRWVADEAVALAPHVHAVGRSRQVCASAFGYSLEGVPVYGLQGQGAPAEREVAFVHGTSRNDKLWPEAHWVELGSHLAQQGGRIGLPHGSDEEEARAHRIAQALGASARVWPRLPLDALTDRLAACSGVVGVDSGLSHIAVALDVRHVQIYNFDTAWRTGPVGLARQCSVYARPTPTVAEVLVAWQQVTAAT